MTVALVLAWPFMVLLMAVSVTVAAAHAIWEAWK